jgi:hypothetical protein
MVAESGNCSADLEGGAPKVAICQTFPFKKVVDFFGHGYLVKFVGQVRLLIQGYIFLIALLSLLLFFLKIYLCCWVRLREKKCSKSISFYRVF